MSNKEQGVGECYRAKRAGILKAIKLRDFDLAMQRYDELAKAYAVRDSGQIELRPKKKKRKKQKPVSVKKVSLKRAELKPVKKKKKQADYNNKAKRLNRRFVAESYHEELVAHPNDMFSIENVPVQSVKKALLLPSENLDGIIQFFEMGVFDKNTQLICIEREKKKFNQWHGRGFGKKLREAQKRQGKHSIADAVALDHKEPVLIHGEIGKRKKGEWDVDLADIDEIDFVWLDFMGTLLPRYYDWIREVLRNKITKNANVSVTAMASCTGKFKWARKGAMDKRAMIDEMVSKELIEDEVLYEIMEEEFGDEQWETWRQDNVLIAEALRDDQDATGCWVRKSQGMLVYHNESPKHTTRLQNDVQKYTGDGFQLEMATHKFYYADSSKGGLDVNGSTTLVGELYVLSQLEKLVEDGVYKNSDEAFDEFKKAMDNGELSYTVVG